MKLARYTQNPAPGILSAIAIFRQPSSGQITVSSQVGDQFGGQLLLIARGQGVLLTRDALNPFGLLFVNFGFCRTT
jgi:hypothetical protein